MHVWNVQTGKELSQLANQAGPESWALAFSPDARFLAGVTGERENVSKVQVWELLTGGIARQFAGHASASLSACFSADGRSLVTGGSDSTILIWDLSHGAKANTPLSAQELTTLWDDLASTDAARACKAVWTLAASPSQTIDFVKPRLKPVAKLDASRKKQVAGWIADLDASQFERREKATTELEKVGEPAIAMLTDALKGKLPPEAQRRAQELLDKLTAGPTSGDQ